jgi:hypothetical protein
MAFSFNFAGGKLPSFVRFGLSSHSSVLLRVVRMARPGRKPNPDVLAAWQKKTGRPFHRVRKFNLTNQGFWRNFLSKGNIPT